MKNARRSAACFAERVLLSRRSVMGAFLTLCVRNVRIVLPMDFWIVLQVIRQPVVMSVGVPLQ